MIVSAAHAIFADDVSSAVVTPDSSRQLLFVPPICGFTPPLRNTISAFAMSQSLQFSRIRLIEFPGQNGRPGFFSVLKSAEALTIMLQNEPEPEFTLFGMCSGAIACVQAAVRVPNVANLILWEMAPRYVYDARHRRHYERCFDLTVCDQSYLAPLQPIDLVSQLKSNTIYAISHPSIYCDDKGQRELVNKTSQAKQRKIYNVTHFLGGSGGAQGILELLSLCKN